MTSRPLQLELATRGGMPGWVGDRDWALMALLAFLNIGSLLTTILGARQILPSPMAEILGIAVQGMLFVMLAGFAGEHAPVRKWIVVIVFAMACVYCSFFTYFGQLARKADEAGQLANALQTHAELGAAVYTGAKNEAERLRRVAEELDRQANDEATRGTSTGMTGYGPRAKQMRTEANDALVKAQLQLAVVEQLAPHFEFDTSGLTPEEVFRKDLAAWTAAPAEWKVGVPRPDRDAYVDASAEVAFLTPFHRVWQGDTGAIVSLTLASLVDGMAIFLGTAIDRRRGRHLVDAGTQSVTSLIHKVRSARQRVTDAMRGRAPTIQDEDPTVDRRRVMVLRVDGPGSKFLAVFYDAIHPETYHFDYDALSRHSPEYQLAGRILFDRFRSPEYRWITTRPTGGYEVREDCYHRLAGWLAQQIHLARQAEDDTREGRDLRVVLPLAE